MLTRDAMPRPVASRSHYFITFSRGESLRCIAVRPWLVFMLIGFAPILLVAYFAATAYLVYRDDMLAGLMARQNEIQYTYEDRIAAMRRQVDRATSRQLLDQNTLEGRIHELLSRQAQIENRAAMISSLAQLAGADPTPTGAISKPGDGRSAISRALDPTAAGARQGLLAPGKSTSGPAQIPAGVSAFAPPSIPGQPSSADKPRPEDGAARGAFLLRSDPAMDIAANPDMPVETRLSLIDTQLRRLEGAEVAAAEALGSGARRSATRLRAAIREAGLSPERFSGAAAGAKSVGGPFVPINVDPKGSTFERVVYSSETDFTSVDSLSRAVKHLPLRKPLDGALEVTSPFGARIDPFFGRMATHTGVDLRQSPGAAVRATAAGKVTVAGWTGGYGNMVEIDHGGGFGTRYGHLSSIAVEVGQSVDTASVIGRVGSTGRSTGPHLHYEVRVDGDPVDPMRFLRAGTLLASAD